MALVRGGYFLICASTPLVSHLSAVVFARLAPHFGICEMPKASDPTYRFPCMPGIGALLVLLGMAGCQKPAQIGHYQVPAEESTARTNSNEQPAGPDRMLAAIVPHAGAAWFFKLAGPAGAVAKHAESFNTLIQSVSFTDDEAKPKWTLPQGWKQTAGGADLRFATLTVSEKPPLEVTITTLPWSTERDLEQLLSNLNRWRAQMSQAPLDTADLADTIHSVKLADSEAILVDFPGTLKPGGMQPPMAAAAKDAMKPAANEKASLPAGHPPITDQPKSTEVAQADQSQLPFTFDVPKDWAASKPPQFALAAFTAKKDSQEVQITISPLGRGVAGILEHVNRWREQIKLPKISEDELNSVVKPYQVDGKPAQMVQVVGPEAASPRLAITVVMFDLGDATWFFRMRGDSALVSDQQANFEKFVGSVKFREVGK